MSEEEKNEVVEEQEVTEIIGKDKKTRRKEKMQKPLTVGRLVGCGIVLIIGIVALIMSIVFIRAFYNVVQVEGGESEGVAEAVAAGCAAAFAGIIMAMFAIVFAIVALVMGIIAFNLSIYWVKKSTGAFHVITLIEFILSIALIVGILLVIGIFLIKNRAKAALMGI